MTPRFGALRAAAFLAAILSPAWTVTAAAQQTGRIQGTVVAEGTNQPLVGAQVLIEGTSMGIVTNDQGQYQLVNVPAGRYTVRATTIGHSPSTQSVEVTADATATADFSLAETAVPLEEIVVTGTAAQTRRKEVGNSIAAISARDIENVPVVNASEVLAGRAPGVTFMANSGQPGSGSTIKIRGINSVSQDAFPLIYVDGVRIYNEPTRAGWGGRGQITPLQDISPEDINRIEVVKGAAATTLYGTEASAGVIQIFTKRGIAGDPIWNAEMTFGINDGARWGTDADPTQQYINCGDPDLLYNFDVENGGRVYFEDPTCPADGNWMRRGAVQNYSLSVRGGIGNVTYFASGNYGQNEGILPTQVSRDGGFRANVTFSPIEKLSFTLNNAYQKRNTVFVADGNNAEGFLLNVGRGAANYLKGGREGDCDEVSEENICITNRYVFESDNLAGSDHFTSGLTVRFTPNQNFTHRFTAGYDYTYINTETTLPFAYLTLPEGYYWDENTNHTKVSLDYTGSFENQFGDNVASTFSWGGQLFRDHHRWTEIDVQNFAGPGEPTLESGAELTYRADEPISNTNAGFFLQEQVGWQDRLFITAGLRVDGNSAFGDDFGLQPYPKLSTAFVISDYDWWPADWWETFKLRAAVGESGKAPDAFDKVRTWQPVSSDDGEPGFSPLDIGNDEVGPERSREIEAGFDASLFSGRLGLEVTGFHTRTIDALVPRVYPPSEGFLVERTENIGEIVNRGLEFGLTAGLLRTASLDWEFRFNGTLMDSEVVDLDDGRPDTTRIYTGLNSYLIEGQPGPVYVGPVIKNPNELAGPQVVTDTIIGQVYPNRLFSFGTTLRLFDRITLDALAEYQGGHYVQNYTGYQSGRRGSWHTCVETQEKLWAFTANGDASSIADLTAVERARCAYNGQSAVPGETVGYDVGYWTEKGDFLKLRHISATLDIPQRFVTFASGTTLTLSARNLFTITDYAGADPEVMDGADQSGNQPGGGEFGRRDYYQIPPARTFLMSLRFTF